MSEPRSKVVALAGQKDLRLVLHPAKRGRVNYSVAVALEGGAERMLGLWVSSASRLRRQSGISGKCLTFSGFDIGSST
jgi:hypothetical protein